MNTLFHFGDSYADNNNGSGTFKLYSEYVADSLRLSYENLAWGGFNNQLILHTLLLNLDRISKGDFVFLNYSFESRFLLSIPYRETEYSPKPGITDLFNKKFITSATAIENLMDIFNNDKNNKKHNLEFDVLLDAAKYLQEKHQSNIIYEYIDTIGKLLIDRGCKPYVIYNAELINDKLKNWTEISFGAHSYSRWLNESKFEAEHTPLSEAHCKPGVQNIIAEYILKKINYGIWK